MHSKTRIIILRMKSLIYTFILFLFALILIFLFVYMFFTKSDTSSNDSESAPTYTPGTYTTSIHLGETPIRLQVNVDEKHINSIESSPLSESVTASYPLMESCLENITMQLTSGVALENVVYDESSQYTSTLLLDAINIALDKAAK